MTHHQAVETMAAERYLLDEMTEIERYGFEEHFFECDECAETMRVGHQLRANAKDVFGAMPAVQPEVATGTGQRRAWWAPPLRVAIPWAAAALLALALILPSGGALAPAPGQGGLAQVFAPTPLRPASRGAVPEIVIPDQGSAALALDVNIGAPGDEITYTLSREQGDVVATDRTRVPSAGVPLVIVVPADRLRPGGGFLVALTAAADPSAPPSEYRFNAVTR
jgi:hypothetical protein